MRDRSIAAKGRIVTALSLGLALLPAGPALLAQPEKPSGDSPAVFDAPGKPGVRMMAPIPDAVDGIPIPTPKPAVEARSPVTDSGKSTAAIANSGKPAASGTTANRTLLVQAFVTAGKNWNRARLLAAES